MGAIAGEFKTLSIDDAWAVQRDDSCWLLDGLIPIPELKDRLEIDTVPEEERGRYYTLSGMLRKRSVRSSLTFQSAGWAMLNPRFLS